MTVPQKQQWEELEGADCRALFGLAGCGAPLSHPPGGALRPRSPSLETGRESDQETGLPGLGAPGG